jgi:hypothetical protein
MSQGHPQSNSCQPPAPCYQHQEAVCHQTEPCQSEHYSDCGQQHCDSFSLNVSLDVCLDFGHDCGGLL